MIHDDKSIDLTKSHINGNNIYKIDGGPNLSCLKPIEEEKSGILTATDSGLPPRQEAACSFEDLAFEADQELKQKALNAYIKQEGKA